VLLSPVDFDDVTSARCAFPEDWRGSWYESRDGDVTITSTRFSNKGTCVETDHRFYYLIENRCASAEPIVNLTLAVYDKCIEYRPILMQTLRRRRF
jgi:hypothetical protein